MKFPAKFLRAMVFVLTFFFGVAFVIYIFGISQLLDQKQPPAPAVPTEDQPFSVYDEDHKTPILTKLGLRPEPKYKDRQLFAVMIENHEHARPHQRGLEHAVVVEEWMVEGLISRFVALYDITAIPDEIGPIRSLRPYFIDGTLPWTRFMVHAGGSPEALEKASGLDNYYALNGISGGHDASFVRDPRIAAPHNFFLPVDYAKEILKAKEEILFPVTWPPYELGTGSGTTAATAFSVNYFNPVHNVSYAYDEEQNYYVRDSGATEDQARPSNILMITVPILSVGEYGRLNLQTIGEGDAMLFHSGNVWNGTWSKASDEESMELVDEWGNPMQFAQGQIWITIVPDLQRVSIEEEVNEEE